MKTWNYFFSPKSRFSGPEPVWKDKVERWTQVDENAFAVCEALSAWELPSDFDQILFVCEGASNLADADFVNSKAVSPSKFVYTLPSIAPSVGLQLLNWRGPVICFCLSVNDQNGFEKIRKMAEKRSLSEGLKSLVIHLKANLNPAGYRVVNGFLI